MAIIQLKLDLRALAVHVLNRGLLCYLISTPVYFLTCCGIISIIILLIAVAKVFSLFSQYVNIKSQSEWCVVF